VNPQQIVAGQIVAGRIASAAVILLAAYFIRGITAFGSGLISVPPLAAFLPLQCVVPLILLSISPRRSSPAASISGACTWVCRRRR
jgi:hypothetical protein